MVYQPIRTTGGMVPAKPKPKPLPQQNQMQVTGGQGLTTRGQPLTRGTATAPMTQRPTTAPMGGKPITKPMQSAPPPSFSFIPQDQRYAPRFGPDAPHNQPIGQPLHPLGPGGNVRSVQDQGSVTSGRAPAYAPMSNNPMVQGGGGQYQTAVAPSYIDRYQTAVQGGGGGGFAGGYVERYTALSGQGAVDGPSDPEMDFQAMYPDPDQHPEGLAGYLRDRNYARQKKQAMAGMNQGQAGYATQYGAGPGQPGIGAPMVQQPSSGGGFGPGPYLDMYGRLSQR